VVFEGYQDWSVDFFDRKIEHLTGYPKKSFDSRRLKWCDLILRKTWNMSQRVFIQALKTGPNPTSGNIASRRKRRRICLDFKAQGKYFAMPPVRLITSAEYSLTSPSARLRRGAAGDAQLPGKLARLRQRAHYRLGCGVQDHPVQPCLRKSYGFYRQRGIGQKLNLLFPEASREESLSKIASTSSGERWESVEIPFFAKMAISA